MGLIKKQERTKEKKAFCFFFQFNIFCFDYYEFFDETINSTKFPKFILVVVLIVQESK